MNKFLLIGLAALTIFCYFLQDMRTQGPKIVEPGAGAERFSAVNAMAVLNEILEDRVPHPTGSAENAAVRDRIIDWLARHGVKASVQQTWGCSALWGRCSPVENIVAVIEGRQNGPYVALMAHYDSTPASVGAGDNGAGVATIMEIARLFRSGPTPLNPILILLTDAEENGLLGAEAFFSEHPLRHDVGVVINLEASTTTGRSFLFRTSGANRSLVDAYANAASHPLGSSLYNEIFKRMPSDTDFSVPKRLGIPGLDFVFVGEKNHHHTSNDNPENLNPASVQHHGDNMYPLARALAGADISAMSGDQVVYGNVFGFWMQWPVGLSWVLVLSCMVLLATASVLTHQRWRKLIAASMLPPALLIVITFCLASLYLLVHFVNGTTAFWPAHELPFRVILFAVPVLTGLLVSGPFNREFEIETGLLGVWWFWALLALVFSLWLPDAAHLFVLPLIPAAILLAAASLIQSRENLVRILQLLTVVLVVPVHLNLVLLLEQSQGYWLIATSFLSLALFVSSCVPLARGWLAGISRPLAGTVILISIGAAVMLPVFSAWRPQTSIFQFTQDHDRQVAWLQFVSLNRVPPEVSSLQSFDLIEAIYPWTNNAESDLVSAEPLPVEGPSLQVLDQQTTETGRTVIVRLASPRGGRDIGIVIEPAARATSYELYGRRYAFEPLGWGSWEGKHVLELRGIENQEIDITLDFESRDPAVAWLFDTTRGMEWNGMEWNGMEWNGMEWNGMESQRYGHLLDAREPLVVQVHQGDRTLVIKGQNF